MSESEKASFLKTVFAWIKRIAIALVAIALVAIASLVWPLFSNSGPVKYTDVVEHYKYGSIGSEAAIGAPYWIWKVLPVMFPEKLPGKGYESLGLLYEPGKDLPVGFSKSKLNGLELVGMNCAVCHTGSVRDTPQSSPRIIPTMPSHTVDFLSYLRFLSACAKDAKFTADQMLPQIEAIGGNLNPLEKLLYRYLAIPQTRSVLLNQELQFEFTQRQPDWGPGRVDTFNPYKSRQFNFPMALLDEKEIIGTVDFPPVWAQKPRKKLQLHWDGNNDSVDERNNSAALALVTPTTIDFAAIHRVADWLWELPPPAYPYPINRALAAVGKTVYQNNCASCHSFGAAAVGTVSSIEEIGTDRHRLDSYTYATLSNQNLLFADISFNGKDQRFQHFRKTDGYANMPLDGVWLRGPYLHNGSVPTLRDLLELPETRPQTFYRGNDVFDPDKVGFVSNVPEENGKRYFTFDTTDPGNSNSGHLYGTDLSSEEKEALVEYMKQL